MSQVHDRPTGGHLREHSTEVAVSAMETVGATLPTTPSGAPAGFRSDRTLPVSVELRRQLRRRRTQLALALMALLPIILVIAFAFDDGDTGGSVSLVDLATDSATNFAVVCLFFSASFLLIVVIALFFGDTIASEASWSSLRYLLAMPVPRIRLLRQKVIVAGLLSIAALVVLPVVAVIVGLIAYGGGPLSTPVGEQLSLGTALLRLALVLAFIAVQLAWVAGLALMLSVLTDAPLGAVGGAVLLSIVSQILNQIEALGVIRDWLPTHYSFAWTGALVNPIRWDDMIRGGFVSLLYAVVFAAIAVIRFRRKDITS